MKIIIDIPEDEFGIDIQDKFQDFFERVKVDIEHRIISNGTLLCGNYEKETAEMFLASFKRMQMLPDNATVGDIIKAMFPDLDVEIKSTYVTCWIGEDKWMEFDLSLWNAPYRE